MSGIFGNQQPFRKGQKVIKAAHLNDLQSTVKALSGMVVVPPLYLSRGKAGYVLGLGRVPGSGELLLGRSLEDIKPRSFGRWQKSTSGAGADKGDEDWGEEEADDIYNPWGITVPYHSRFQYASDVGGSGPEIVMPDVADEWTAEDLPIFRREDVETDPGA